MNRWIKAKVKQFFHWIFRSEYKELQLLIKQFNAERTNQIAMSKGMEKDLKKFENLFNNLEVSVDHHQRSNSWAVVSIQGQRADYIKFIDLGQRDIQTIQEFLRQFDRSKIDCSPQASKFFKI